MPWELAGKPRIASDRLSKVAELIFFLAWIVDLSRTLPRQKGLPPDSGGYRIKSPKEKRVIMVVEQKHSTPLRSRVDVLNIVPCSIRKMRNL